MQLSQFRSSDGSGTLSYILSDESGTAFVIDPNLDDLPALQEQLRTMRARVAAIIDTHTHVDHISGAGALHEATGAPVIMHERTADKWKAVEEGERFGIAETLRANVRVPVHRYGKDGDTIEAGTLRLTVFHTPGHTDNHMALFGGDALFTGDLLLIGQAGRSDLPGGDPRAQFRSLQRILTLPGSTRVYPGHDYEGNSSSLLSRERATNPFLRIDKEEAFVAFVKDFFPPFAETTAAGRTTLQCGAKRVLEGAPSFNDITPEELSSLLEQGKKPFILDVREPDEVSTMGAIPGARNVPLGTLPNALGQLPDKQVLIITVCQTGSRSYEAAHYLTTHGFTQVMNLAGGTLGWILEGNPVQRENV